MSKEVQNLFTSIAGNYDFLNHCLSFNIDKTWRRKALSVFRGKSFPKILDLCAGTLDLTAQLEEILPQSQIISLDFSSAMLEQGRTKIKAPHSTHLICGDGHQLPFVDRHFDALVCAFGIRNLEKREIAADEVSRVLKPGAELVVLEFFRPENPLSKLFHRTYGNHIIPKIGGLFSKNRQAYEYLQKSISQFFSSPEYCDLLKSKGFEILSCRALSGGIAHWIHAKRAA